MKTRPFLRFPGFRMKALTLSYDDGHVYDRHLREILDRYGIKCTFNLCSGSLNREDASSHNLLTRAEAIALYSDSGHEVACHGVRHLSLAGVSKEMAANDIVSDRIALEETFGRVIKGMAYANGSFDDDVVELLRHCGFEYARTTKDTETFEIPVDWLRLGATCHHSNPRLMELANKFIEPEDHNRYFWANNPKLFYLWGHSFEFHNENNWDLIEDFCKLVGNRDSVWYATNGEIVSYVNAYDSLRFSAQGDLVQNPTCTDVCLSYFGTEIPVPAGKTVRLTK